MTHYSETWTLERQRESNRESYHANRAKRLETTKKRQLEVKRAVLSHYSNGEPTCACCNENQLVFLSLDHINGGGHKRRKVIGSSIRYYYWLMRNDYPDGYRVLCHNCNQATSWGRECPHELLEEKNEL